jgi:fatty acid/phospholipid biosynthesis enzyme
MENVTVAIDAMGGDAAPGVVIRGTVDYLKDNNDISIALVGKEKDIKKEFRRNRIELPDNLTGKKEKKPLLKKRLTW